MECVRGSLSRKRISHESSCTGGAEQADTAHLRM